MFILITIIYTMPSFMSNSFTGLSGENLGVPYQMLSWMLKC